MERGIGAVFGPSHLDISNVVQSLCETMEVPRIETSWENTPVENHDYYFNPYPEPSILAKVRPVRVTRPHCTFLFCLPPRTGLYSHSTRHGLEIVHVTISAAGMFPTITGLDTRLLGKNETK